jgi:hypothetical protein
MERCELKVKKDWCVRTDFFKEIENRTEALRDESERAREV